MYTTKKILLSAATCILLSLQMAAQSAEAFITLKAQEQPFKEFLQEVEKQSGRSFFFTDEVLAKVPTVSVDVKALPLEKLLHLVLDGTGVTFETVGEKIAIKLDNAGVPPVMKVEGKAAPIQVSGVIVDENGEPLPGVAVMIAGTTSGVVSDVNGKYSIKASSNDQLQVSSLGFKTETIPAGSAAVKRIVLKSEQVALEGVVVTALGIKRDEKSIGYSAAKVDSDRFSNSVTSDNWLNSLTGQVAGLSIDRSNSGPNGTMRVTIRGESTADLENNTALFVVDGVPMYNTKTASDTGDGSSYAIDYGDGTADIDPDNIESVTVLKGAAATALYGSQAANGAIIITTKTAENQDATLSVTYKGSFAMDKVLSSPDLQYVYGQGSADKPYYYYLPSTADEDVIGIHPMPSYNSTSTMESWGPKMDGTEYYQYYNEALGIGGAYNAMGNFERKATPFISHGNWFQNYFQSGLRMNNSVTLSGRVGKANSLRVSFSDQRSRGIVPNTPSSQDYLSVRFRGQLAKWLSAEATVNYRHTDNGNIPTSSGYGSTAIMYGLWCYAPNVDMSWPKDYWLSELKQDASLSGGKNNPYFLAYECINTQKRDRVYGNVKFDIDLAKNLTLMLRAGLDMNSDFRTQRQATSTQANPLGYYSEQNIGSKQYTGDFLLKYTNRWNDFGFTGNIGGSLISRQYERHQQAASTLHIPGVYSLANSSYELKTSNYSEQRQTYSLYALLSFSWRDAIFLDVTGRNDWSSTLPAGNRSYFYPSVSGAVALNDLFDFGRSGGLVNLMKIRASWAQVGHDTAPYRYMNFLQTTGIPGTVQNQTALSNANLKPEIVTSWEVGLEMRLFKNRFTLDAAYYDAVTKDLISRMPISIANGVSTVYINAGSIRNRGVELTVSGSLVKTRNILWKLGLNWNLNRNTVVSLGDGIDSWIVANYSTHAYMTAYEGGSLTDMYGKGYKRAPEGSTAIDANGNMVDVSGMILLDKQNMPQVNEELQYLGDCAPKWKGGFNTTFKWKDLTLYVGFDGQFGGHVFSYTNWVLNYRGKGVNTLAGREGGLVPVGVRETTDGNYVINTDPIARENISNYYHCLYDQTNAEANFVSTQFLKLREVRVEYAFPKKLLAKTKVISDLRLSFYGNNLYCWSDFPGFDPEGVTMKGSAVVPGFEILQMPSAAQFGASLSITF